MKVEIPQGLKAYSEIFKVQLGGGGSFILRAFVAIISLLMHFSRSWTVLLASSVCLFTHVRMLENTAVDRGTRKKHGAFLLKGWCQLVCPSDPKACPYISFPDTSLNH